jgi:hypothetical protein
MNFRRLALLFDFVTIMVKISNAATLRQMVREVVGWGRMCRHYDQDWVNLPGPADDCEEQPPVLTPNNLIVTSAETPRQYQEAAALAGRPKIEGWIPPRSFPPPSCTAGTSRPAARPATSVAAGSAGKK